MLPHVRVNRASTSAAAACFVVLSSCWSLACTAFVETGSDGAPTRVGSGTGTGSGASSSSGGSTGSGAGNAGGAGMTNPSTDPGTVGIRRLNRAEYNNTVRDLFGTTLGLPRESFPQDDKAGGFDNNAKIQTVTDLHVGHYRTTAKAIIKEALAKDPRREELTCSEPQELEACAEQIAEQFLPLAFRRPVSEAERSRFVGIATKAKADGGTDTEALAWMLEAALLSPSFLYIVEVDPEPTALTPRSLDDHELATRLSYFIYSSMPDAPLRDAALAGTLHEPAALVQQLERMLADPKAKAFTDNFAGQWLPVRELDEAQPDANEFPGFDEELRSAMRAETQLLFRDVLAGTLSAKELLVPSYGYLNDRLAEHYGLPLVGSKEPVKTTFQDTRRGGLLQQGTVLASYAHATETAPVLRGEWILAKLLCTKVPSPPNGVPPEPGAVAGKSRRERLAEHRVNPSCAACHAMMDPMGLSMENYDVVGAWRETDQGVPIDPTGTLPDGRAFANPSELARIVADDPAFPKCLGRQLYSYALGRETMGETMDEQVLTEVASKFVASDYRLAELVKAVVSSKPFLTRRGDPSTPEVMP